MGRYVTSFRSFFATCPKGMEALLAGELQGLGAESVRETRAGVFFQGSQATAYRACLWSRFASRVLLPLAVFSARTPEELSKGVAGIVWKEHLAPDGTLAVDLVTSRSAITHSHYGALVVKDSIVDQLRGEFGVRPSIDTDRPDIRVNVYLHCDEATVSLDLSGCPLHRRGYRARTVSAPLKENLAAAILQRARWMETAGRGGALVDLMCGSGTLLIEGAMMAADMAPGLLRPHHGFIGWRQHDAATWEGLLEEARMRRHAGLAKLPPIHGYDRDPECVRSARKNIALAGLENRIRVYTRELSACVPEAGPAGLVAVNPPYGERLGEKDQLAELYRELGSQLKRCFPGWRAAVFTGSPALGMAMGLWAGKIHTLYNGAMECKLLHFEIRAGSSGRSEDDTPRRIKPEAGADDRPNS